MGTSPQGPRGSGSYALLITANYPIGIDKRHRHPLDTLLGYVFRSRSPPIRHGNGGFAAEEMSVRISGSYQAPLVFGKYPIIGWRKEGPDLWLQRGVKGDTVSRISTCQLVIEPASENGLFGWQLTNVGRRDGHLFVPKEGPKRIAGHPHKRTQWREAALAFREGRHHYPIVSGMELVFTNPQQEYATLDALVRDQTSPSEDARAPLRIQFRYLEQSAVGCPAPGMAAPER